MVHSSVHTSATFQNEKKIRAKMKRAYRCQTKPAIGSPSGLYIESMYSHMCFNPQGTTPQSISVRPHLRLWKETVERKRIVVMTRNLGQLPWNGCWILHHCSIAVSLDIVVPTNHSDAHQICARIPRIIDQLHFLVIEVSTSLHVAPHGNSLSLSLWHPGHVDQVQATQG